MDVDERERQRSNDAVSVPSLNFQRLRVISPLGRGAKGVVFLVKDEETEEFMALKVISKDLIHRKSKDPKSDGSEYRRVCFEQQVLRRFDHPLLPRLHGVLDTEKLVGYAMDYCSGRDLNSLRKRQTERMFSDDVIRFYAAELVLALEYLHSLGVVYRDLKPENVMIQENGHIMLVDFDLSTTLSPIKTPQSAPRSNSLSKSSSVYKKKKNYSPIKTPQSAPRSNSLSKSPSVYKNKKSYSPFHRFCNSGISPDDSDKPVESNANSDNETDSDSSEKSNSFVGTEEYVAPEIISANGHGFEVDWWSLGVLLYEMLYGTTPFRGTNRKETFYRILTKAPVLTGENTPLRDLIRKLLEKDPKQRIGLEEIKGHDFFRGIGGSWESVLQVPRPPYIPENVSEGTEGIKKIDVESVVEGIFGNEGGENNNNNKGGNEEENKNNHKYGEEVKAEKNVNKRVWEEELNNHHPTQPDTFSVF